MSLRIEGIAKVNRTFRHLAREIDPVVVVSLKKIAEEVKKEAKRLAPVDTGALQKSIRLTSTAKIAGKVTRVGVRAGGFEVNPKTGNLVNYAVIVEFGSSRQVPQGYLIPAVSRKAVPLMRELMKGIRKTVERVR